MNAFARVVLLTFVLGASAFLAFGQTSRPATSQPARVDISKVVHWVPLGGGSNDAATRRLHPILVKGGYGAVDRFMVRPGIDAGARRMIVHNPAGVTLFPNNEQRMDFDQFPLAAEAKLRFATAESFVRMFKPYRAQGVEVIVYLGPLPSATFDDLPPAKVLARLQASVQPVLDAECSLMVDSLQNFPEDSVWFRFLQTLEPLMKSYGGRLYGESVVYTATRPYLRDIPGLTIWNWNSAQYTYTFPKQPVGVEWLFMIGMKPDEETTEPASMAKWLPARVAEVQARGYTAVVQAHWLKQVMR